MSNDEPTQDHWPEKWLAIAEILIGLLFVSNLGLMHLVFGGPILAAGIFTYWNRGRNYRRYKRVQAALGIFLLLYLGLVIVAFVMAGLRY